jgi:hypothetical protein
MGMPFGPDRSENQPDYEERAREQEFEVSAEHDREVREAEKDEPPRKASWWRRMFGGA